MKNPFQAGLAALALFLFSTVTAWAQMTAREWRDEIIGLFEGFGYQVSIGTESEAGDALILGDVELRQEVLEADAIMTLTASVIMMRDQGDGTVQVELPRTMRMEFQFTEGGEEVTIPVFIDNGEGRIRLSGTPDALKIASSFGAVAVTLGDFEVKGKPVELDASVMTRESESSYTIVRKPDGKRRIAGDSRMATLMISGYVKDPEGEGYMKLELMSKDLTSVFAFDGKLATDDLEELLAAGLSVDSQVGYGKTFTTFEFDEGAKYLKFDQSTEGGLFGFSLSRDTIAYDVMQKRTTTRVSSPDLPVGTAVIGYDEVAFSFNLPLSKSDTPRDFHLRTAMRAVTANDEIWQMFDPTGQIPRDPVTLAVSLVGKVKVLLDLMDPEQLSRMEEMDESPYLPVELTLEELTVSFGGAQLTGEGRVDFDADNPIRIEGIPLPVGKVNLRLDGGFGLMDRLAAMGLLPPDAVTGFRAMLGAFARPVGEDQLESTIEVNEQGQISANGIPLQ